jgi:hypothetical protein
MSYGTAVLSYSFGAGESEFSRSSRIYPSLEEDKKLLEDRIRNTSETVWLISWMCRIIKSRTATFDPHGD